MLDASGRPVAGASVSLQGEKFRLTTRTTVHGAGFTGIGNLRPPRARTASDGVFDFDDLEPRSYSLLVEAPGAASSVSPVDVLPDRETIQPDIVLEPGAVLAGRVTDQAGRAIAGAYVAIEARSPSSNPMRTVTATDGAFRFDSLAHEIHDLEVSLGGYSRRAVRGVEPGDVELLVQLSLAGSLGGRIEHRASAEETRPAYVVSISRTDGGEGNMPAVRGGLSSRSIVRDGGFRIPQVPPGTYAVKLATRWTRVTEVRDVVVEGGEETKLQIVVDETEQTGAVSGRVVSRETGAVATDGFVRVLVAGEVLDAEFWLEQPRIGPDGRFEIRGLPTGVPITVEVEDGDLGVGESVASILRPGERLDVGEIRLVPES